PTSIPFPYTTLFRSAGVQGISRKENSHRRAYLPRQGLFYGKGALFLRSKREQTRAARSDLEARHARARIRRNRAFVSREDEKNLAWHRSDSLALPFEAVAPGGGIPSRGERWIYHGNSCGALGGL